MSSVAQRIVFPRKGEVAFELIEVPDPGPHEVLVRTVCTAVSAGTELTNLLGANPVSGTFPAYPGYANVGVVQAVGARVSGVQAGDRVLTMGRHQSHVLLDLTPDRPGGAAYLEQVPAGVPAAHAGFAILGSVALHGIRRAALQVGGAVAIFGVGIVGQFLVSLARWSGCSPIIAVDLVPERLAQARQQGADCVVDAGREDVEAAISRATGGRGAEAVFDATRTPTTLPLMMKVAAMGGKVLFVGSPMGTVEIDAFSELQLKELSILGCFQPAAPLTAHHTVPWTQRRNRQIILQLLAEGRISFDGLITHVVPATEAPQVYAMIAHGGAGWLGIVFSWEHSPLG